MKRCFWVCCIFLSVNVFAQNRGNIWILGYQPLVNDCGIDFNSGFADTFSVWKNMEFFYTNASICDTAGDLQFYSNGIYIANRNHDTLYNSNNFNPGYATEAHADEGLSAEQAVLILPTPKSESLYTIVHFSGEHVEGNSQTQPLALRYSVVDISLDNGLGGILPNKKTISLVNDTLVWGRTTACKHANGFDWWIITHRWNSDLYYKFLLTKDSIYGPFEQHVGSIVIKNDNLGQACFSPDGTKFCYVNKNYNFDYMQFDRCSGEFSNAVNVVLPDSNISQGCAFSASSRFLFINTLTQLFQFDTWAPDLDFSKILVDTIPFEQPTLQDWFSQPMLAPDSKIYISTFNSIKALHVINNPDSIGTSCDFQRKGLILPMYNGCAIPNLVNYDLSQSDGIDTCESIYTTSLSQKIDQSIYRIYPNPVSDWLNIIYQSNEDVLLELFDLYGKRVGAISLFHYFKNRLLNVSELPPGVYLAAVSCKGERVWSEKVVVQR